MFTLLHSLMIFCTFRRHSSAALSYPAVTSSLARSGDVGGATGAKGRTERALLNFFWEKRAHILSMLCWCGSFFFFFFLSLGLAGGATLLRT